eukprot:INCI6924.1.p1 GENE.INCI6924.1~~INCI6924.1.p1  ORF type:complete len:480 (-),score=92.82 INCI6924.1:1412-2692(-)
MNEESAQTQLVDDFDDDGLGDLEPVEGESPGLPQSPGPASSAASALAAAACEEDEMRKELWSEFQAVEDQCDIAAQMMDAMAAEGITSIPDLLLDIVDFLDLVRPRLLKLTQEGSVGELDEESFAKSLEVNDRVCTLLKKFISIERTLMQQQHEKALQAQQEALARQQQAQQQYTQRHRVRGTLAPSGGGGGSSGSGSGSERPVPPPPPPTTSAWTSHMTKDGRTYYYNHDTKLSVWTRPVELGPDPNAEAPPQPVLGTARASTPAAAVRVINAVPAGAASAAASPPQAVRVSPAAQSVTPALSDGESESLATTPVVTAVAAAVHAATPIASSSAATASEISTKPLLHEADSKVPSAGTDATAVPIENDAIQDVAGADHAVGGENFSPPPAYDEAVEDVGDAPPAYSAVAETGTTPSTDEFSLDDL